MGASLCGCWAGRFRHLVVWLLQGPSILHSCADSGKDVVECGRGGGVWCRIAPGEVVSQRVLRVLRYGDDGGGVFLRRPPLWDLVRGMQGDSVVMFPAVVEAAASRKAFRVP